MTGDRSASAALADILRHLFNYWQARFNRMAEHRADWFTNQTEKAATIQIKIMLKHIGVAVEFKNSHYVNNIMQAIYAENVSLIKSIPQDLHDKVQGIVMRGVQAGNDQHFVAQEIRAQFGKTTRRARFIARDQTAKANAAVSMARSSEAGIEYGFWMHRSGSRKPRPTHVAMSGKRFKLSEGIYDSAVGYEVKPAELPGCLCAYRPDLSSFNPQITKDSVSIGFRRAA
jgi:SPP1 gp7 family putative phage head morphogenesis protein